MSSNIILFSIAVLAILILRALLVAALATGLLAVQWIASMIPCRPVLNMSVYDPIFEGL
jgi:hypothetical protein